MKHYIDFRENQQVSDLLIFIEQIMNSATEIQEDNQPLNVILSGGNTPLSLYSQFRTLNIDWLNIHFWLADERCVSFNDAERTEKTIRESVGELIISKVNFHSPGFGLPIEMANNYIQELSNCKNFKLAILGIGEDGHTASLFPGNDNGESNDSVDVFPVNNSPKMPSKRITLSLNKINQTEHVIFLVSGESKKEIVKKVINGEKLPASKVRGLKTTTIFYLMESK